MSTTYSGSSAAAFREAERKIERDRKAREEHHLDPDELHQLDRDRLDNRDQRDDPISPEDQAAANALLNRLRI